MEAGGDTFEVSLGGCGRGTPEEGGIGPGVDAVGGVFEVLWVDVVEGRQRKEASLREWMQSGMFFEVLRGGCG